MAQEREYSKLIDNANAPIFGVDTQGRVNIWNKCARKLVGYTLDEVMGQNLVGEFITKEYRAAVSAVLDKALKGEETANFGKFELRSHNTHLSRWSTSFLPSYHYHISPYSLSFIQQYRSSTSTFQYL